MRSSCHNQTGGFAEQPAGYPSSNASDLISTALCEPNLKSMQIQLKAARSYGGVVERIAARFGLLPSIIAGFCSRRTSWGLDLDPKGCEGTGDFQPRATATDPSRCRLPADGLGFIRGLMGLDIDRHGIVSDVPWHDPEANLKAAFDIVLAHQRTLGRRTTLQGTGLLRASLTAFECGILSVERAICAGLDVDSPTSGFVLHGKGCGSDVLARAAFFQAEGWD